MDEWGGGRALGRRDAWCYYYTCAEGWQAWARNWGLWPSSWWRPAWSRPSSPPLPPPPLWRAPSAAGSSLAVLLNKWLCLTRHAFSSARCRQISLCAVQRLRLWCFLKKMIGIHAEFHENIGGKSNSKTPCITRFSNNFGPFLANWALKFQKLFLHKIWIWVSKQLRILRCFRNAYATTLTRTMKQCRLAICARKKIQILLLKVPKREIFDHSDFPDFYTIKSLRVGDYGVKIKYFKNI
jgi:hypothetical protein